MKKSHPDKFANSVRGIAELIEAARELLNLTHQYKQLEAQAKQQDESDWTVNRLVVKPLINLVRSDPIQKKREEINAKKEQVLNKISKTSSGSGILPEQALNIIAKQTEKNEELKNSAAAAKTALKELEKTVTKLPSREEDQTHFAFYLKSFITEAGHLLLENNKLFIENAQENITDENTKKLNAAITAAKESLKNFPTDGYKPGKEAERDPSLSNGAVENNGSPNLSKKTALKIPPNLQEVICLGDGSCTFNALVIALIAAYLESNRHPNPQLEKFFKTENFKKFLTKLSAQHKEIEPQIERDPKAAFGKYLSNVPNWNDRQRNMAQVLREISVDLTTADPKVSDGLTQIFHAAFFDYCVMQLKIPFPKNLPQDDVITPLRILDFDEKFAEFLDELKKTILKQFIPEKKFKKIKTEEIDAALQKLNLASKLSTIQLDDIIKKSGLSFRINKYWAIDGCKIYEKVMRKAGTFAGDEHATELGDFFGTNIIIKNSEGIILSTTAKTTPNTPIFVLTHYHPGDRNAHYNADVNAEIAAEIHKEMNDQAVANTVGKELKVSPSEEKAATIGFSLRKKKLLRGSTRNLFPEKISKSEKKASKERPKISEPGTLRKQQFVPPYHPLNEERKRNFLLSLITVVQTLRLIKTINALVFALDENTPQEIITKVIQEVNLQLLKIRGRILTIKYPTHPNSSEKISEEKFVVVENFLRTINELISKQNPKETYPNILNRDLDGFLSDFLKSQKLDLNYDLFNIDQCQVNDLFDDSQIDKTLIESLVQGAGKNYDDSQLHTLSNYELAQALDYFTSELKIQRETLERNYLVAGAKLDPLVAKNNIAFLEQYGKEYTDQNQLEKTIKELKQIAPSMSKMTLEEAIELMTNYWNNEVTAERPTLGKIITEEKQLITLLTKLESSKSQEALSAAKESFAIFKEFNNTKQYEEAFEIIETQANLPESNPIAQGWLNYLNNAEKVYKNKITDYEKQLATWEKRILGSTPAESNGNSELVYKVMPLNNKDPDLTEVNHVADPTKDLTPEKLASYGSVPPPSPKLKAIVRSPSKIGHQPLPLTNLGASTISGKSPEPEGLVTNLSFIATTKQTLNETETQLDKMEKMLLNVDHRELAEYAKKWKETLQSITANLQVSSSNIFKINDTTTEYLRSQSDLSPESYKSYQTALRIVQSSPKESVEYQNLRKNNLKLSLYAENFEIHIKKLSSPVTSHNDYLANPANILKTVAACELAAFSKETAEQLQNQRIAQEKRLNSIKNLLLQVEEESSDEDEIFDNSDNKDDEVINPGKLEEDEDKKGDEKGKEPPKIIPKPKPKPKKVVKPKILEDEIIVDEENSKDSLAAAQKAAENWLAKRDLQLQKFEVFVNSQNWVGAKARRNMIIGTVLVAVGVGITAAMFGPGATIFVVGGAALLLHYGQELVRARLRTNELKTTQRELFIDKAWGPYEIVHKLDSEKKQKILVSGKLKECKECDEGLYILKLLQTEPNYNAFGYRKLVMESILLRHTGYSEAWDRFTLENPEGGPGKFTGPQHRTGVLGNKKDALNIFKTIINECLNSVIQDPPDQYQRIAQLFTHLVNTKINSKENFAAVKDCANEGVRVLLEHNYDTWQNVKQHITPEDLKKLLNLLDADLREYLSEKPAAAKQQKSAPSGAAAPAPKPLDLPTLMLEIKRLYAAGYKAKDKNRSAELLQQARDLIQQAFLICYQKGPEGAKVFANFCLDDIIKNPPASDKKLVIATELEMEFLEKIFPPNNAVLNHEQKIALESFALNTVVNSEKAGQILGLMATSKNEKSGELIDRIIETHKPSQKTKAAHVDLQLKSFGKLIADMFKNSPQKFIERFKNLLQKIHELNKHNEHEMLYLINEIIYSLTSNPDIDLTAKNIGSQIINAAGEFSKKIGHPWLITELISNHSIRSMENFGFHNKLLHAYEKSKYGPLIFFYEAKDPNSEAYSDNKVRQCLETIYSPEETFDFKYTVHLNLSRGDDEGPLPGMEDSQPYGRFKPPFQYLAFKRFMKALTNTKKDAYSIQTRYRIIKDYLECLQHPPIEPEELQNFGYAKLSQEQKNEIKENIKVWLQDLAIHIDALGLTPGVDKKIAADYVTSILKQIDELDNCQKSRKSSIELLKSLPEIAAGKLLNWGLYTKIEEAWFENHQHVSSAPAADVIEDDENVDEEEIQAIDQPADQQISKEKLITPEQLQTLTPDQHTQRNIALWEATLNEKTLNGKTKDDDEQERIKILKTLLSMIYYGNLQYRPDKKSEFRPAAELNKPLADWVSQGGRFNISATPEQLQEIWELIAPYISHNGALSSAELQNEDGKFFFGSASTHAFKEVKNNGETVVHESKLGIKNPKQLPEYAKNSALVVAANIPKTLSNAVRSNKLHEYPKEPINLRMNFGIGGVGNQNDINGENIAANGENGNILIYFDPKHGIQIGFETAEPKKTSLYGHNHGARGKPSKHSFTGDLKLDDKKARNARKAQSGQNDPGKHDCTQIDLRDPEKFTEFMRRVTETPITSDQLSKAIPNTDKVTKAPFKKNEVAESKAEKPEKDFGVELSKPDSKEKAKKENVKNSYDFNDDTYQKNLSKERNKFLQNLLSDYQVPKVEDKKPEVEEQLEDKRKKAVGDIVVALPAEDKQSTDPLQSSVSDKSEDIAVAEDKKEKAAEKPQKSQKEKAPEYDAALLRTNMLLAIISEHPNPQAENFDRKALELQISKFFSDIKAAVKLKFTDDQQQAEIIFTKIIKQLILSLITGHHPTLASLPGAIKNELIAAVMQAYGEVNATSTIVLENPQSGELTTVEPCIAKKHLHVLKLYRDIEKELKDGLLDKNNDSFSKTDSGILFNLGINENNSISFSYNPNNEQFFQILNQEIALWEQAKEEESKLTSWVSDLLDGFIKINCPQEENIKLAGTSIVAPRKLFGHSKAQKYARAMITQIVCSIIKESGSKDLIDKVINDFRNYYITKLATNEYEKKYYNDQIIDLFVDIENNLQENLSDNKIHSFTWKTIFISRSKSNKTNSKKSFPKDSFSTKALLRFLDYLIPITANSRGDYIQLRKALFALNAKIPEEYDEKLCTKFFYDIFSKDRDNADKNIQIILRSLFSADGMQLISKAPDEEIEPLTKFALIGYCQHLSLWTKPDSAKSFFWKSPYTHFKELGNWIKSNFKNAKKVMDLYENTVDQLKDQKEFTIVFQKPASWLTFFGKTQNQNNENKNEPNDILQPLLESDSDAAPQGQENRGKDEEPLENHKESFLRHRPGRAISSDES